MATRKIGKSPLLPSSQRLLVGLFAGKRAAADIGAHADRLEARGASRKRVKNELAKILLQQKRMGTEMRGRFVELNRIPGQTKALRNSLLRNIAEFGRNWEALGLGEADIRIAGEGIDGRITSAPEANPNALRPEQRKGLLAEARRLATTCEMLAQNHSEHAGHLKAAKPFFEGTQAKLTGKVIEADGREACAFRAMARAFKKTVKFLEGE